MESRSERATVKIFLRRCVHRVCVCLCECARPHVMRNSWSIREMDEVGWSSNTLHYPSWVSWLSSMLGINTRTQNDGQLTFSFRKRSGFFKNSIISILICSITLRLCFPSFLKQLYSSTQNHTQQWLQLTVKKVFLWQSQLGKLPPVGKKKKARCEMWREGMQMSHWLCTRLLKKNCRI